MLAEYDTDKDGKVSSSSKAKEPELTEALKAALAAQGMSSWRDLAFLELSIFLGRPAGSAEAPGLPAPPALTWRRCRSSA